ncbi:FimD/PapC C-terminal domain-containing protein [Enterobacter roggenkampii]|uniref:FimD/PapC C-terminal domain-containing protein n=1 Tax=Enterobacter roggenkampii TaxID=1812935 RepID=UPI00167FF427|nr:FimD/PapC C-terminal domain-containing protein [Enterobacter roggenkampii]
MPFGAKVRIAAKANAQPISGIVGDDGQVYLTGMDEQGELFAQWGNTQTEQCSLKFVLPKKKTVSGVKISHDKCL